MCDNTPTANQFPPAENTEYHGVLYNLTLVNRIKTLSIATRYRITEKRTISKKDKEQSSALAIK